MNYFGIDIKRNEEIEIKDWIVKSEVNNCEDLKEKFFKLYPVFKSNGYTVEVFITDIMTI